MASFAHNLDQQICWPDIDVHRRKLDGRNSCHEDFICICQVFNITRLVLFESELQPEFELAVQVRLQSSNSNSDSNSNLISDATMSITPKFEGVQTNLSLSIRVRISILSHWVPRFKFQICLWKWAALQDIAGDQKLSLQLFCSIGRISSSQD